MITTPAPGYKNEGKNQLVVAIGCTKGMHRSVAMAEAPSPGCSSWVCAPPWSTVTSIMR